MTFDLAQMIADRDAGTPGEWACHFGSDTECQCKSVVGEHGGFGAIAIICSDNGKRIGDGGNDAPSEPEAKANARRIARVPFLEAEIIHLTARVAELEGALAGCVAAIEHADMSDGVCCCGDNMEGHSDPMNCGHSPTDMGEYHAHHVLSVARAALSTPTDEPKT